MWGHHTYFADRFRIRPHQGDVGEIGVVSPE